MVLKKSHKRNKIGRRRHTKKQGGFFFSKKTKTPEENTPEEDPNITPEDFFEKYKEKECIPEEIRDFQRNCDSFGFYWKNKKKCDQNKDFLNYSERNSFQLCQQNNKTPIINPNFTELSNCKKKSGFSLFKKTDPCKDFYVIVKPSTRDKLLIELLIEIVKYISNPEHLFPYLAKVNYYVTRSEIYDEMLMRIANKIYIETTETKQRVLPAMKSSTLKNDPNTFRIPSYSYLTSEEKEMYRFIIESITNLYRGVSHSQFLPSGHAKLIKYLYTLINQILEKKYQKGYSKKCTSTKYFLYCFYDALFVLTEIPRNIWPKQLIEGIKQNREILETFIYPTQAESDQKVDIETDTVSVKKQDDSIQPSESDKKGTMRNDSDSDTEYDTDSDKDYYKNINLESSKKTSVDYIDDDSFSVDSHDANEKTDSQNDNETKALLNDESIESDEESLIEADEKENKNTQFHQEAMIRIMDFLSYDETFKRIVEMVKDEYMKKSESSLFPLPLISKKYLSDNVARKILNSFMLDKTNFTIIRIDNTQKSDYEKLKEVQNKYPGHSFQFMDEFLYPGEISKINKFVTDKISDLGLFTGGKRRSVTRTNKRSRSRKGGSRRRRHRDFSHR